MSATPEATPGAAGAPSPKEATAASAGAQTAASVRQGRLEVLGAGLLWSLGGVFVKSIQCPAPVIAMTRSFIAALVMLPFVRRRPARSLGTLLASVLCYAGVVSLFVWSTKITTAANAILLQYTAPAFVFLIEWAVLGARPSRRNALSLAGGMAGVLIIYLGSEPGDLLGIVLALASGILFAAWMVLAGRADLDPTAATVANNLGAALLLLPIVLVTGAVLPTRGQLLALALMGTVQLGLPYLLFSRGVRRVMPQEASLIVLIEPVLNPLWVALVVGERPSLATLAGGAVILATLALRYLFA